MSDTLIAVLIVPFLVALAVVLECTRIGCTWLGRQIRAREREAAVRAREAARLS